MNIEIRALTQDLVEDYVRFHVACLVMTYAALTSPEYARQRMAEHDRRAEELRTHLAQADHGEPFRRHLVALNARGGIVGVGCAGDGIDAWEEEAFGDDWVPPAVTLNLDHLYVAPELRGTGLARRMVDELIGDRPAFLWAIGGNHRAVRFYEKLGFAPDGFGGACGPEWDFLPMMRLARADITAGWPLPQG